MHTRKLSQIYRIDVHTLAIVVWALGLVAGIYLGTFVSDSLSAAIYNSCFQNSFFFIPAAVLPITLVFIVSGHSMKGLIYPILFFKALTDGIILFAIGRCFGSASWLMGIFVLFSDRVATVFLLYYAIRILEDRSYRIHFWYFMILLFTVAAMVLDRYFISSNLIFG